MENFRTLASRIEIETKRINLFVKKSKNIKNCNFVLFKKNSVTRKLQYDCQILPFHFRTAEYQEAR